MLSFLRRYQRIFFFFITIAIVVSFVFFGISPNDTPRKVDNVVAKTLHGKKIKYSDVQTLSLLLSTHHGDQLLVRGLGPHIFSQEVLVEDFFNTGLAEMLVSQYGDLLRQDLNAHLEKEKHYVPYVHPHASFITAKAVWNRVTPELNTLLANVKQYDDAVSLEAFNNRVRLFTEEGKFSTIHLWQALQSQEQSCEWLQKDPNLTPQQLSLFQYETLEDWFGTPFMHLVSQFIFNIANIAEKQGYQVSVKEAVTDLQRQNQASFELMQLLGMQGINNSQELWQKKLEYLGLDDNTVVAMWQKVMLFRRLLQESSDSVFLDPLLFEQFGAYANETVEVEVYQLPEPVRLRDFEDLMKFEVYLSHVSNYSSDLSNSLTLPTQYLPVETIEKSRPELVSQKYELNIKAVDRDRLKLKIAIKEIWDWEETHFEELQEAFPFLAQMGNDGTSEVGDILESLSKKKRVKINDFVVARLLDDHSEWIEEAFNEAESHSLSLDIRLQGTMIPLLGANDPQKNSDFIQLLMESDKDTEYTFSFDDTHIYRFYVLEGTDNKRVLTFEESKKDGTIDKLLNKQLLECYTKSSSKNANLFRAESGAKKSPEEAREEVSDLLFKKQKQLIMDDYVSVSGREPRAIMPQFYSGHRFFSYMNDKLKAAGNDTIVDDNALTLQWKLMKTAKPVHRKENAFYDRANIFSMEDSEWSEIFQPYDGDLNFIQVTNHLTTPHTAQILDHMKKDMAADAKRAYVYPILQKMQKEQVINLDYLARSSIDDES